MRRYKPRSVMADWEVSQDAVFVEDIVSDPVKKHTKKFGVYHWDTFDNETMLIHEADTLHEAQEFVDGKYYDRISHQGADQVDIVDETGDIVQKFRVR